MMLHRNNGKAYLLSLLVPLIIPLAVVIAVLSSGGMALADDHDVELQDVMDENVPNLTATVNGSGGGYYGDSLRVSFSNDTTQTLRIKIPIGLRLAPKDTSVQTMVTAGGEIITVPPGDSSAVLKAFCGEMNDSAPGTLDVFYPDGFVDSKLMKTLKRINEKDAHDSDGQDAVWSHTDGNDISDNEKAKDLAGGNKISGGKATAAGVAGAAAAGATSSLLNKTNGNGGAKTYEDKGGDDLGPKASEEEPTEPPEEPEGPVEADEHPPPEEPEEAKSPPDEQSGTEPARFKEKQDTSGVGESVKATEAAASVQLLDPKTGKPLLLNEDGKVFYGKEWISPDEAAKKIKVDQEWLKGRQDAEEAINKFKKTLKEYNNTDPDARSKVEAYKDLRRQLYETNDPAKRTELEQKLRQQKAEIDADDGAKRAFELNQKLYDQAVKGNENYDVKSIMKREGMTDTNEVFDRAVQSAYREIDQKFVDKLNEMGFRRGGRKFTIEDLKDFRNNSSYGKPSMDRDYGLNEDKIRELTDKLNKAKPGSPEAQEIAKQIAGEHAKTKITVDPDQYASHLRRGITETNSQLDKLRSQLENVPDSSAEANRINAEIERLSGRPDQLKQELNQIEAKATRIKEAYIKDLQTRLDKATPGSPEAQRLTSEISDAKTRYAGKTDIELSPSKWHDGAEGVYKRTFNDVTRTDPEKAFQSLTHSKHKEAYQDMNVLRGEPADPRLAEQTTSVSRIKEIENNQLVEHGKLSQGQAIQETVRGYEKDLRTKVLPQLSKDPNVEPEKLDMLKRIREVFDKAGKGEIRPGEVDGALRQAVPEVKDISVEKATRIIDANYESSMKYQGTGTGGEPPKVADTGVARTGAPEDVRVEKAPDIQKTKGSSLTGGAFSKVSDLAVVENYYKQNIAQGMDHGEALSVATAQTAAGNVAQMSGAADPRISMAGGSLLPNGMNNMLPDQAIENWTGTTYQAGKAGLESLKNSFESGQLDTSAVDKFAENVMNRPGNDPFKGIGQISQLVGEETSRTDGGNIVSDLQNIYNTGAGSEVINKSMQEFQQNIAEAKPGERMVALQGWDHLARSVSEVVVDPVHEVKSLVNDVSNMFSHGVGDQFWSESWESTKQVLQDTPLVGHVIKGYNEIAIGLGDKGVVGFTQEMKEGANALIVEAYDIPVVGQAIKGTHEIAIGLGDKGVVGFTEEIYEAGKVLGGETAEYVGDSARSAYNYIKGWFSG